MMPTIDDCFHSFIVIAASDGSNDHIIIVENKKKLD